MFFMRIKRTIKKRLMVKKELAPQDAEPTQKGEKRKREKEEVKVQDAQTVQVVRRVGLKPSAAFASLFLPKLRPQLDVPAHSLSRC